MESGGSVPGKYTSSLHRRQHQPPVLDFEGWGFALLARLIESKKAAPFRGHPFQRGEVGRKSETTDLTPLGGRPAAAM